MERGYREEWGNFYTGETKDLAFFYARKVIKYFRINEKLKANYEIF